MIRIFFLSVLLFAGFFVNSQNLNSQIRYLQIVNSQKNLFIVNDNIRNAELCADGLLYKIDDYDTQVSLFFLSLSQSYFLLEDYDLALYTVLRQRILFHSDSLDVYSENLLNLYMKKIEKKLPPSFFILNKNLDTIVFNNSAQKVNFLFSISFFIYSKSLNKKLWNLIYFYNRYYNIEHPFGMAKWKLLNEKDISFRKQTKYILIDDFFNKTTQFSDQNLIYNLPLKLQKRL